MSDLHELPGDFPTATVEARRPARQWLLGSRLWLVTGLCVLLAGVLVMSALKARGRRITITFQQGHGIKPGDTLRHRGIDVGEVLTVDLNSPLTGVHIQVMLTPQAATLARTGSQFWIERAQLSLARVRGLETVIGPKYLGVIPGPETAAPASTFEGLETPPTLADPTYVDITIRFRNGEGLQPGDPVRHRGISVGEVLSVQLDNGLSAVQVRVRLVGMAVKLARLGTQFWVERPRLTLAEVRGLDTLLSGRYLSVLPGPESSEPARLFEGLDSAPAMDLPAEGLEVILEGPQRWGLERGVPVTFRGLQVGHVVSVGLATDATRIEARAFINAKYTSLLRDNSVFWSTSGIDVNLGLSGLQLTAETLATIAAGGVAFATPNAAGKPVATGHRFVYHKSPEDEWLAWQPRIARPDAVPSGLEAPVPQRAVVRWTEKKLGFRRTQERRGWVLWLDTGMFVGPADLLIPGDKALEGTLLEAGGQQFAVVAERVRAAEALAFFLPEAPPAAHVVAWQRTRVRLADAPEDCLLIADPQGQALPIPAERLTHGARVWQIASTVPLTAEWHGAAVVAMKDGNLLGVLRYAKGQSHIALWPQ